MACVELLCEDLLAVRFGLELLFLRPKVGIVSHLHQICFVLLVQCIASGDCRISVLCEVERSLVFVLGRAWLPRVGRC